MLRKLRKHIWISKENESENNKLDNDPFKLRIKINIDINTAHHVCNQLRSRAGKGPTPAHPAPACRASPGRRARTCAPRGSCAELNPSLRSRDGTCRAREKIHLSECLKIYNTTWSPFQNSTLFFTFLQRFAHLHSSSQKIKTSPEILSAVRHFARF